MIEILIFVVIFAAILAAGLGLWRLRTAQKRREQRRRRREAHDEAWERMLREREQRDGAG
jgi:type II secretory pathway pseudopilin PulG